MDWIKIIGVLTGMLIVGIAYLLGAYAQQMTDSGGVSTYQVTEYHDAPMGLAPTIVIILVITVIIYFYWVTKDEKEDPKLKVTCPKCGETFDLPGKP
jgi:hypothetical protein